ncbi:unnamed protein product [Orchesella dallaii]|uniref:Uncharacterized protein n=1 Tax=Orchesella dallaii TaxID=48710 RepID=A0ABP1RWM5_9HEXA
MDEIPLYDRSNPAQNSSSKKKFVLRIVYALLLLALCGTVCWFAVWLFGKRDKEVQMDECYKCSTCKGNEGGCLGWNIPFEKNCQDTPVNRVRCKKGKLCYRANVENAGAKFFVRSCLRSKKEGCGTSNKFNSTINDEESDEDKDTLYFKIAMSNAEDLEMEHHSVLETIEEKAEEVFETVTDDLQETKTSMWDGITNIRDTIHLVLAIIGLALLVLLITLVIGAMCWIISFIRKAKRKMDTTKA